MSVKLILPDRLRYSIARGKGVFEVNGGTIGECLDDMAGHVPGIQKALFYNPRKKALHSYVKVLLNHKRVATGAFAAKVKAGDEIRITMKRN